ncbi:MAG TPA: lytic transglycosylase domain-containing protein [Vicinamibacteria bacterium]|nr:lytic transglycosylase domain-containing protein [Vicinamibacteria bacterium]
MGLRPGSSAASTVRLGVAAGAAGLALIVGIGRYAAQVTPPGTEAALTADEEQGALVPMEDAPPPPSGWDISNLDHPRVDYWIGRFQTDKREQFEGFLQRKGRFEPLIAAALAEQQMPQDLLYLAMVESGFQTKAYSRAHAAGMWQFIRGTAVRYGLDINRAVDERNDPVKATTAALRYLKDLHRMFGSWYLAAASYNTGERRVARIMRRAMGRVRGTDGDYYRIWPHLPPETRDYVPLMIAAARISKDPGRYGFDVKALDPWAFEQVVARPATPLATLARQAGTTVAAIRALNPHLKLDRTRNDQPMSVRVPARPSAGGSGPGSSSETLAAD